MRTPVQSNTLLERLLGMQWLRHLRRVVATRNPTRGKIVLICLLVEVNCGAVSLLIVGFFTKTRSKEFIKMASVISGTTQG